MPDSSGVTRNTARQVGPLESLRYRLRRSYWSIKRRVPDDQRAFVRTLWEGVVNRIPDAPFLAARRRYGSRLEVLPSAAPSVLLRVVAGRKRIPSSLQTFDLLGRPDVRLVSVESQITRVIFWTGDYWIAQHGAGLNIWAELCARAEKIVEIGANVGYYTVVGGEATTGEYSAYEPHPRSCAALRANLELNRNTQVTVVQAAAVPESELTHVELLCPVGVDNATPTGAMVKGSSLEVESPNQRTESYLVEATSFSAAVDRSDLIKIDVEGLEAQLINSAWASLVAGRPAIMVEIHDHNTDLRRLVPKLMRDLHANAYAIRGDHLVPVAADALEDGPLFATCRSWDYLLVPAARASLVAGLVRT